MADNIPMGMEFARFSSLPSLTGDKGGRVAIGMLLNALGGMGGGGGLSDAMSSFRQPEIGEQGQFDPSAPPAMPVAPAVPTGFELQGVPPPGAAQPSGLPQLPALGQSQQVFNPFSGQQAPDQQSMMPSLGSPMGQQLPNLMDMVKKHFGFGG